MNEEKTCWTCKKREQSASLYPCLVCDELLRNKWEPRDKDLELEYLIKEDEETRRNLDD